MMNEEEFGPRILCTLSGDESDASLTARAFTSEERGFLRAKTRGDPRRELTRIIGPQRVLVAPVYFDEPLPDADVISGVLRESLNKAAAYVREASFGKAWLSDSEGNPAPGLLEWTQLGIPNTATLREVRDATVAAVGDRVDLKDYEYLLIFGPFDESETGNVVAMATVGRHPVPTSEGFVLLGVSCFNTQRVTQKRWDTVCHELGHNFGLLHAAGMKPDLRPVIEESEYLRWSYLLYEFVYGNEFSLMGMGKGHLTAFEKDRLGWIPRSRILTVARSGRYEIAPLEVESAIPQALRVHRHGVSSLWIEFRQPIGFDGHLPPEGTEGAHLHLVRVVHQTQLDATPEPDPDYLLYRKPVLVGESVTEPVSGTTVTAVEIKPGEPKTLVVDLKLHDRR